MMYLIETEYVGPDKKDNHGNWRGDTRRMEIWAKPGCKNQSHEPCTDGWLGTTNDECMTAHGEYATIDDARAEAHRLGFTILADDERSTGDDSDPQESWMTVEASREQWDAGDWFASRSVQEVAADYGITATSSDDDLERAAVKAAADALADDIELRGTLNYFQDLRNRTAGD